jgi:hypothetical protein
MVASRGRENSFLEAQMVAFDDSFYNLGQDASNDIFRNGTGLRGRVGSFGTVGTITLANRQDSVKFQNGMVLEWAATTITAATGTGTFSISRIDRNGGILYGTYTKGTSSTIVTTATDGAGVYLFEDGDAPSGSPDATKMVGLDGWLPAAEPGSSDSFFGVNRSTDTQRLSGVKYDGTGQLFSEAILDCGAILFEAGGRPDYVVCNPKEKNQLVRELQNAVTYNDVRPGDVGNIFFKGVKVESGAGSVTVLADPHCPVGVAYMLQMNTWKLYHMKGFPHVADEDGIRVLRKATEDAYEVRFRYWAQLGCNAPGHNARITLAS